MLNPYFLMVILYLGMAVLLALDNALGLLNIVPGFQGIRWLRVHRNSRRGLPDSSGRGMRAARQGRSPGCLPAFLVACSEHPC